MAPVVVGSPIVTNVMSAAVIVGKPVGRANSEPCGFEENSTVAFPLASVTTSDARRSAKMKGAP